MTFEWAVMRTRNESKDSLHWCEEARRAAGRGLSLGPSAQCLRWACTMHTIHHDSHFFIGRETCGMHRLTLLRITTHTHTQHTHTALETKTIATYLRTIKPAPSLLFWAENFLTRVLRLILVAAKCRHDAHLV